MINGLSQKRLFGSVLVLGCMATSTQAAVSLSIDNVIVPAGTVAEVGVYATSDSNDVITGFNLPTDLNDDGYTAGVLPPDFTLDATPMQNNLYSLNATFFTELPQTSLAASDGIATASGDPVQLGTTPTLLFDLAIDVDAAAPDGAYLPLEIKIPPLFPTQFNIAGSPKPVVAAPTGTIPVQGSVTVSVPEPSSIFLSAAGMITAGALRRNQRRTK